MTLTVLKTRARNTVDDKRMILIDRLNHNHCIRIKLDRLLTAEPPKLLLRDHSINHVTHSEPPLPPAASAED